MVPGGKGNGRGGKHLEIRIDIYTLKVKKLKVFIAQLSPTLCDPMDCGLPGSSVHGNSRGKNTGVGRHSPFQGIFLAQGSNPDVLRCRLILYCLSHQGKCRAQGTLLHTL